MAEKAHRSSSADRRVRLGLVLTGGTIGSYEGDGMLVVDITDSSVERETQLIRRSWTGPQRLDVTTRVPFRRFSEDLVPADWVTIADTVRSLVEVEEIRNVVVMHGTDTMGYTAAALSYLLADLDATVVLTGSALRLDEAGSDGPTNVRDALLATQALQRGVYLSFAGTLGASSEVFAGHTVRKVRADGRAFIAPNHGPVATVSMGAVRVARPNLFLSGPKSQQAMSSDAAAVVLYPGIDFDMITTGLITAGKRGVVVRMYPGVTGPELAGPHSLTHFIQRCLEHGIVVVSCVEQFVGGGHSYPSGVAMEKAGAIFAHDMIFESAYVKLCWALAQSSSIAVVRDLFAQHALGGVPEVASN